MAIFDPESNSLTNNAWVEEITPEQIVEFARRTHDINPYHQIGEDQVVLGTQLINRRLRSVREALDTITGMSESKLTYLKAKMLELARPGQVIEWEATKLNVKGRRADLTTKAFADGVPTIDLSVKIRKNYPSRPRQRSDYFCTREYDLLEEDARDSEFPALLVPPTLIEWQTKLIGDSRGLNLEMEFGFYKKPRQGPIEIQLFPPIKKPRDEQASRRGMYFYKFEAYGVQDEEIISSGKLLVANFSYVPPEEFKPLEDRPDI